MFCVIQKVVNKKPDPYGEHKELLVDSFTITYNGVTKTKYTYRYSDERFERPIRDAYKIMIHMSYRDGLGKVKKQQWVICTMSFYNLLDSWPGDCINAQRLQEKLSMMGLTEQQLWEMVNQKLDPIIKNAKDQIEKTQEYRAKKKHEEILAKHRKAKIMFERKYGEDTYEYCYDVYGNLRNEAYLKELEENYRAQEENRRSYYSNYQSNYSSTDDFFKNFSSYFGTNQSNYTDEEKSRLKTIYRTLSKTFHPDITKDDGEMMKLINKLKEGWGI